MSGVANSLRSARLDQRRAELRARRKSRIWRAQRCGGREGRNRMRHVRLGRRYYAAPKLLDGPGQRREAVRGPWSKGFSATANEREGPRAPEELAQIVLGACVVIAE